MPSLAFAAAFSGGALVVVWVLVALLVAGATYWAITSMRTVGYTALFALVVALLLGLLILFLAGVL